MFFSQYRDMVKQNFTTFATLENILLPALGKSTIAPGKKSFRRSYVSPAHVSLAKRTITFIYGKLFTKENTQLQSSFRENTND